MQPRMLTEIAWPFEKARCGVSLAVESMKPVSSIFVLTLKSSISFKCIVELREALGLAYPLQSAFPFLALST